MATKYLDKDGLEYFYNKLKTNFKYKDIVPEQTRIYTEVIGTANNWAGTTFFYGSIKPTSWNSLWRIKYRIRTYVPNKDQYDMVADVMMSGTQSTIKNWYSNNTVGTYYPAYYHELYRIKQTGFTNGYGHALGVRFQSAYNPIDTNYKRTIIVEIIETENCEFTFFDSCLLYASIPGTGSTNYDNYTEINYATNGLQEQSDANDVNYQNREYYGSRTTVNPLYRYQLCLTKPNGALVPVNSINNSVATNKTLTTESFDPFGEIFYWNSTSTYAANANIGNGGLYRQYLADLRYSFNCGGYDTTSTLTARNPLYLVAVPKNDGMAVLYSSPLSESLPTTEDGLLYIYLGRVYEDSKPYRVVLSLNHPIYVFKDGGCKQYTPNGIVKLLDSTPYLLRPTGGRIPFVGRNCYDTIVGASVAENQLVQSGATSVTVQSGHKYYAKINGTESLGVSTGSAITINDSSKDMVTDLSLYLPANIVDYIYSLETATAGSGIAKLREWGFLRGYQAFNAGSIESVEVTGKVARGFNQWDEVAEVGTIIPSTGQDASSTNKIRSKNYIPVIPSAVYHLHVGSTSSDTDYVYFYDADKTFVGSNFSSHGASWDWNFTVPDNAYYMRFIVKKTTDNTDICINLSSDRNGEYEAYVSQTYDYGDDVLNGIFQLDANHNLYADGDVKTSDGMITRNYGTTTITGDSDIRAGATGMPFKVAIIGKKHTTSVSSEPNGICDKLVGVRQSSTWGVPFTFSFAMNQLSMYFKLSDSITTIEDAKTWLTSNPITLVYELATPTTETSTPFHSPQVCYPDGTEEFVTENGVPVGHETEYTNENILLAGTGLIQNQNTINHINSITAQTTQALYPITIDAQGHISGYGSSVTIPTNLVNGSTTGSLRSIGSDEESSIYTIGQNAFAEGSLTRASGNASHAEGATTTASNYGDHAEGVTTFATGSASHSEGSSTYASGVASHAQNYGTKASSDYQTALGKYNIEDSNDTYAVIIGNGTSDSARSNALTVDWNGNIITNGQLINQQGNSIYNNNLNNLVDGSTTGSLHSINSDELSSYTMGQYAVALGGDVKASGNFSTALNFGTVAASNSQTAIGKYNTIDSNNTSAFIIGNGTADDDRSNALTVDWNGNVASAGYVQVGGVTQYRDGSIEFTGNAAKATAPSSTLYRNITFLDNEGRDSYHRLAFIEHYKTTANENCLQLGVYNHMAGTSSNSWPVGMRFTVNSSQNYFAQIWGNTTVSGSLLTSSGALYSRLTSGEARVQVDNNGNNKIYMYSNSNGIVGIYSVTADGTNVPILGRANNSTDVQLNGSSSSVRDVENGAKTTFQYSAPGMAYGNFTWLAAWNGYNLQAVNKSQFVASSDIRLKENIKDTTIEALPIINKIQIREFDWIEPKEKYKHQPIGMVADEIEKIDPYLTFGGGYTPEGTINVKAVDTFYLTGYLVKAVQELSTKIEKLEAKLYKYK